MLLNKEFYYDIFLGVEGSVTSTEETKDIVAGVKRFDIPDFQWFYPKHFSLKKENVVYFFCEEFIVVIDSLYDQYRFRKIYYSSIKSLTLLNNKEEQQHFALQIHHDEDTETIDSNKDSSQDFKRYYMESLKEIHKYLEEKM